jgi:hypothetical protein
MFYLHLLGNNCPVHLDHFILDFLSPRMAVPLTMTLYGIGDVVHPPYMPERFRYTTRNPMHRAFPS